MSKDTKKFNETWVKKQSELHKTYKYDIGTIIVCALLIVFCMFFWLLFIHTDMFSFREVTTNMHKGEFIGITPTNSDNCPLQ